MYVFNRADSVNFRKAKQKKSVNDKSRRQLRGMLYKHTMVLDKWEEAHYFYKHKKVKLRIDDVYR